MRGALVLALAVVLVVGSAPAAATAAGSADRSTDEVGDRESTVERVAGGPAVDASTSGAAGGTIRVEYALSLAPEGLDEVRVRAVVRLPSSVSEYRVRLPPGATVESTEGFERGGDLDLRWDGTTDDPTVTYTAPAERTSDTFGGLTFTATEEWALVDARTLGVYSRWRYYGSAPAFEETFAVSGEGYAGEGFAYVGPHDVDARSRGGTVRLVVPDRVDLRPDREAVFATLFAASDQLSVGADPHPVNVFVAPEGVRRGGRAGPRSSEGADVWVRADVGVGGADATWLHEYVHAHQSYNETAEMAWFDEASAEYYAALLALRQGRASFDGFRRHVARSEEGELLDRGTWTASTVEYTKGSLVLAALDAEIRNATNDGATLVDVFRRMNARDGPVSYAAFTEIVASVAGERLDHWLDRHVAGPETPAFPADRASFVHPSGTRDADGDGRGDAAELDRGTDPFDADTDGDGLDDGRELDVGTDPTAADTDDDGLDDGREVDVHGTDPLVADTDGDLLSDGSEVDAHGTDPLAADTDDDGLDDRREVTTGTDPTVPDSDLDSLSDGEEVDEYDTDPTDADTDGDGLRDGAEVEEYDTDPLVADTDGDGLADASEVNDHGTDPLDVDTDGDGYEDGSEADVGTDPTAPTGTLDWWLAKVDAALP